RRPSFSHAWNHLTAELALTSKRSAASRRDAPSSTASITRSRKSDEQGLGMAHPQKTESLPKTLPFRRSWESRFNSDGTCSSVRIGETGRIGRIEAGIGVLGGDISRVRRHRSQVRRNGRR